MNCEFMNKIAKDIANGSKSTLEKASGIESAFGISKDFLT